MSYRAELACAARWLKATADRLPVEHQPDLALEWRELEDRLEDCRSDGSRELTIIDWRGRVKVGVCGLPGEGRNA